MNKMPHAVALAALLALSACATNGRAVTASTPDQTPPSAACTHCTASNADQATVQPVNKGFAEWLSAFRIRLAQSGARPDTIASMLDNLEPDEQILERDQSQPEFVRPIWAYLDSASSDLRIANGQNAYAERRETIDKISAQYGVRAEILLAIWGLESAYGTVTGNRDIVRSLATLAWEGRRRDWAENQLIAAAKMIDLGYATRDQLTGSWAGAMGQTQFLPTTYLERAADWDGDGRRNIWTDEFDALASAANLLHQAGWQTGAPVMLEVMLPGEFSLEKWNPEQSRPVSEWAAQGIRLTGDALWTTEVLAQPAILELPAGRSGPAFLTFQNFRVIKRYNNSTLYALGVAHLADRIAGGAPVAGQWPKDNPPITRSQTLELQAALNTLGYNAGPPDGLAGPNTRRALREFQRANKLDADGYAGSLAFDAVMAASVQQ